MKVADLFVNLAVGGAGNAIKAISGVKGALSDSKTSALAMTAAVAGAVVGFERLTGWASEVGLNLDKFNALTGLSTTELQKWQYAAMRFDVSGNEMASTVEGVQNAMTQMALGKGVPEGFDVFARTIGFDQNKARDTFYVMGKIEEFVKKVPADVARQFTAPMGISQNMFQFLKLANREKDKIQGKDIITKDEVKALREINMAWKDFWFSLKTMGIKVVASESMDFVHLLSESIHFLANTFDDVKKLFIDFPQAAKMFKVGAAIIIGILGALAIAALPISAPFLAIAAAITSVILLLSQFQKLREGKDNIFSSIGEAMKDPKKTLGDMWDKGAKFLTGSGKEGEGGGLMAEIGTLIPQAIFGKAPSEEEKIDALVGTQAPQNVSMTNTFHIDGSESPDETAQAVQKQISNAARQLAAQAGGR